VFECISVVASCSRQGEPHIFLTKHSHFELFLLLLWFPSMEASGNMINVNNNNTCNNKVVCFPTEGGNKRSIGHHIARRLVEIGVKDVFSVPGDFNLGLLDYLVAEADLNLIGCCNELNAGYGADGYARCKGVGACVVTFNVGGLSILNAIAGAYSEDLPVICIVGAPNSNDYGSQRIIHHSIGLSDFSEELRCFQPVTCHQVHSL